MFSSQTYIDRRKRLKEQVRIRIITAEKKDSTAD
jgi:hypothetical protein